MSEMSRLEELIAELCPDGVEYKTLGDVVIFKNGKGHEKDIDENGEYIVVNSKFISTDGDVKKYSKKQLCPLHIDDILMVMSDLPGGRALAKCFIVDENGKYTLNQRIGSFHVKNDKLINTKYLYYILNRNSQLLNYDNGVDQTNLKKSDILGIKIPLPPLVVQREIVRILDAYSEKVAELTDRLAAELDAREKQVDYYHNLLFNFGEEVERKPMGDLFPFIRNGFVGTVTPYFTDEENGVRYLEGTNIHNGEISDDEILYVNKEFHEKHLRTELKADDILMVQSGHVGECAVVGEKYEGANCHALIVMSNGGGCDSRFMTYYFYSLDGKKKLRKITTGETVKHILASAMKKYAVPVPPLPEQKYIVDILDRMYAAHNNCVGELTAEIEARRKQYEHYRDQLLTFKEKTA